MNSVKCGGCEKEYMYISETATGHKYTLADVTVLVREDSDFKRKEKSEGHYNPQEPISPE